jgi:hypothetical protein
MISGAEYTPTILSSLSPYPALAESISISTLKSIWTLSRDYKNYVDWLNQSKNPYPTHQIHTLGWMGSTLIRVTWIRVDHNPHGYGPINQDGLPSIRAIHTRTETVRVRRTITVDFTYVVVGNRDIKGFKLL